MNTVPTQWQRLFSQAAEVIPSSELLDKLRRSETRGRPLRIKAGIDPTSPRLHVGHLVLLQKMRQFQDLGHEVILLIGDFTGTIGDPSGRSETRKPLSRDEVLDNAKTYQTQAFKILDPARTTVRFNSEWTSAMTAESILRLASAYTVARMLEREDFQTRYRAGAPIGIHEFLYPLLQGQDSVMLQADVELGGTDQKFNMLVGRDLQRDQGQSPQVVLTLPLLLGTDGHRKMSKSFGNEIAFEAAPADMFGKVMSLSDTLMMHYYELLTDKDTDAIKTVPPMEAKLGLAFQLVARLHGHEAASHARKQFDITVGRTTEPPPIYPVAPGQIRLVDFLYARGWGGSKSDMRRLILQGAVEWNGRPVTDPLTQITIAPHQQYDLKVGKKIRYLLQGNAS